MSERGMELSNEERVAPWKKYKTGDDPEWRGRQPNADWVCARWDELWRTQKHGHYETLMRVVLDARKREYHIGMRDGVSSMVGPNVMTEEQENLATFYNVSTLDALVDAQARHIEKLQAKLPRDYRPAFHRVREG